MISLTAGRFRGVPLFTPPGDSTRPSAAKLRQALFNSCQSMIPDARVLDLFAGSGALGFEALSRGAAHVTLVEKAPAVSKIIRKNIEKLKSDSECKVVTQSVESYLKTQADQLSGFDLVLVDPPYALGCERLILDTLGEQLKVGAWLYLEWSPQQIKDPDYRKMGLPDRVGRLVKIREKAYGDTSLTTYEAASDYEATDHSSSDLPRIL